MVDILIVNVIVNILLKLLFSLMIVFNHVSLSPSIIRFFSFILFRFVMINVNWWECCNWLIFNNMDLGDILLCCYFV